MAIEVTMPKGNYVMAASGGVDSMVLLDILAKMAAKPGSGLKLVVAHFDHGIRDDSAEDRKLVQRVAAQHGLPFVYDTAKLGKGASEAKAREARYGFLNTVKARMGAKAIITAHHKDDVLETIIINWLRGTKSRGLSSLRSGNGILRPLLPYIKQEIRDYATAHQVEWREDSTNSDETYLRNYVRAQIVPKLDEASREQLMHHSERAAELNGAITQLTSEYLERFTTKDKLERAMYRQLPEEVSREVLAQWLRTHTKVSISTKLLTRLDTAIRQGRNNSLVDIAQGLQFKLEREFVVLESPTVVKQA